jgi:hypothetical protein
VAEVPIDISDLPSYGPAVAAYRQAKNAAVEAGDESAAMRAEMEWTNTKMSMMQEKLTVNDAARALDEAKAKAKQEFPNAPEEIWGTLTDPSQLLASAKAVHDRITAAMPQQDQGQQTSQGSWGGSPPAASNTAQQTDPNVLRTPEDVDRRVAEIMPNVMRGGKLAQEANEEVVSLRLEPILSRYQSGAAAR